MARQPATVSGVWRPDSVKDVAESIGISNLPDDVARALAGDVEYRLWDIIEESLKFMRHARRTKLKIDDVDQALQVRNLEPLWGFSSTASAVASQPFKKTVTATGTVYHVDEQEIDLAKVISTEVPSVPRDISFTAHWLAIEGVQPLIKENPTPQELARYAPKPAHTSLIPTGGPSAPGQPPSSAVTPLVKHVLSRELQLYFTRLVDALGSGSGSGSGASAPHESSAEVREAALGSVRNDPGLHQLVPYLIAWAGEQIATNLHDLSALQRALDLFHAMLENPTLFVEPYLHQLTPPILTCLLTSALPPPPPTTTTTATAAAAAATTAAATSSSSFPSAATVRTLAASLLHLILERYAYAYPSLLPRITKTLLRGLAGEGRGLGARWGAARGLGGIVGGGAAGAASVAAGGGGGGGNRAVREWVGGGLKPLGEMLEREEETYEGERAEVVREIFNVLRASVLPLSPTAGASTVPVPAPPRATLVERYGPLFADAIAKEWNAGGKDVHEAISGEGEAPRTPSSPPGRTGRGLGGAAPAPDEDEQDDPDADEDDEEEMDEA